MFNNNLMSNILSVLHSKYMKIYNFPIMTIPYYIICPITYKLKQKTANNLFTLKSMSMSSRYQESAKKQSPKNAPLNQRLSV